MEEARVKSYPVKPKLKTKPRTPSQTLESNFWSSFKTTQINNLISVPSLTFSPTHPHSFAAAHVTSLSIFNPQTLTLTATISSFKDTVSSASFRSDSRLIAASDLSGLVQVFDVNSRTALRRLRAHTRPVRFVHFPVHDKLHLISAGDDSLVKYWDYAEQKPVLEFRGHKDYVRCGDSSPVNGDTFLTGSYDHLVKLWDVRVRDSNSTAAMQVNHGAPVEDVIFLPSGGMFATAGGNSVKLWDMIGGGKLVGSMESHNKTVTSICVGRIGKGSGEEESNKFRIMSVGLDGYLKVFDYASMKVTFSMRFPAPLLSVAYSPDCSTRVIGTSNGIIYAGKRKMKEEKEGENEESESSLFWRIRPVEHVEKQVLKPSNFRYFHRGQGDKPREGDYLVMRPKKVKLAQHDKLLKKFRHGEALVSVLESKNPGNVVAVMEELVARRKLLRCVSDLDSEKLEMLLVFLHRYCTEPRYSSLLMGLTKKVLEMRADDIRASQALRGHIRNLKRSVEEEIRVQQSLQEIQGIISPLLRIAGRR
ncbi:protein SLOW WALKER 1 [Lotus japonicus]|uniref:protein SLOW WALKER 1 n=1 Tax=Lotus japonicus TaxID=34305 RepID=UPI00259076CD|nr:protein SLOW WALKER 1 [Lotus japonicus]